MSDIKWDPVEDLSDPVQTVQDIGGKVTDWMKDNKSMTVALAIGSSPFLAPVGIAGIGMASLFGKELDQLIDVGLGDYARDQKELNEKNEDYEELVEEYKDVVTAMEDRYVIDDEIFQLAVNNRNRETQESYEARLTEMRAELDRAVREFEDEYDFIQDSLGDKYKKYFMWLPLVVGGLAADTVAALVDGDWDAAKRVGTVILQVIGIVVAVVLTIISWGGSAWITVPLIISAVSQLVALAMSLDATYAQGLMMNAAFSVLDFLLNEVLNLDESWEELGTEKLSDTQYYQELAGYVSTINMIVGMIASLMVAGGGGVDTTSLQGAGMAAQAISAYAAVTTSMSYQAISTLYNGYTLYNDIQKAEEAKKALEVKLCEDIERIQARADRMKRQKILNSYKAEEQILTATSSIVSEYVMSSFSDPTSTFDPVMTIAANYGYESTSDNIMDFVPEFTTDYTALAGGEAYVRNILYRI